MDNTSFPHTSETTFLQCLGISWEQPTSQLHTIGFLFMFGGAKTKLYITFWLVFKCSEIKWLSQNKEGHKKIWKKYRCFSYHHMAILSTSHPMTIFNINSKVFYACGYTWRPHQLPSDKHQIVMKGHDFWPILVFGVHALCTRHDGSHSIYITIRLSYCINNKTLRMHCSVFPSQHCPITRWLWSVKYVNYFKTRATVLSPILGNSEVLRHH